MPTSEYIYLEKKDLYLLEKIKKKDGYEEDERQLARKLLREKMEESLGLPSHLNPSSANNNHALA